MPVAETQTFLSEEFEHSIQEISNQDVISQRERAYARFAETGLPHRKLEEYKFTDLSKVVGNKSFHQGVSDTTKNDLRKNQAFDSENFIVLRNGKLDLTASKFSSSFGIQEKSGDHLDLVNSMAADNPQ